MEIENVVSNMWVFLVLVAMVSGIIGAVDGFIFGRLTASRK